MKIKLYRSATVGIDFGNFKILTDPWLTDGEYYGSWSHYPYFDINLNLEELNSYDVIYVSHIHPDHCSENTLKKLNKNIPILIHKFHSPFLKNKLQRIGFNKILELENGIKKDITKDLGITIYAADNCDPMLCYKFTGCANLDLKNSTQQIDTLSVIEYKNNTLINVNDCPFSLAKHPLNIINQNYKKIDVLLTGYGGAGPYPQCFDNLSYKEKIKEADIKKRSFLDQAHNYIKLLKPQYYLPFAGTYVLSGHLSKKQKIRGVPTLAETYKFLDDKLKIEPETKHIKSIKIGPDETFNFNDPKNNKEYLKLDFEKQEKYIADVLSKRKFDYEVDAYPSKKEIQILADKAFENFKNKKIFQNSKIDTDILINCDDYTILLPFDEDNIRIEKKNYIPKRNFLKLSLDIRLLKRILMGPKFGHWNNAEIGSHISYFRSPNIFNRNLHLSLCNFHC
jgi:UDP-MurNAc hydroxylase|tara:strand:- start:106 stop:1461 length:1356 start_codon:yes stop_codon:yes gene_type:complete